MPACPSLTAPDVVRGGFVLARKVGDCLGTGTRPCIVAIGSAFGG